MLKYFIMTVAVIAALAGCDSSSSSNDVLSDKAYTRGQAEAAMRQAVGKAMVTKNQLVAFANTNPFDYSDVRNCGDAVAKWERAFETAGTSYGATVEYLNGNMDDMIPLLAEKEYSDILSYGKWLKSVTTITTQEDYNALMANPIGKIFGSLTSPIQINEKNKLVVNIKACLGNEPATLARLYIAVGNHMLKYDRSTYGERIDKLCKEAQQINGVYDPNLCGPEEDKIIYSEENIQQFKDKIHAAIAKDKAEKETEKAELAARREQEKALRMIADNNRKPRMIKIATTKKEVDESNESEIHLYKEYYKLNHCRGYSPRSCLYKEMQSLDILDAFKKLVTVTNRKLYASNSLNLLSQYDVNLYQADLKPQNEKNIKKLKSELKQAQDSLYHRFQLRGELINAWEEYTKKYHKDNPHTDLFLYDGFAESQYSTCEDHQEDAACADLTKTFTSSKDVIYMHYYQTHLPSIR